MTSYICLNCGKFAEGNEERRLLNLCPECERSQTHSDPSDRFEIEWQVDFRVPESDRNTKSQILPASLQQCINCDFGRFRVTGIDLRLDFPVE